MVPWTNEERNAIIRRVLANHNLTKEDVEKLCALMPERTARQIRDQYSKTLKAPASPST